MHLDMCRFHIIFSEHKNGFTHTHNTQTYIARKKGKLGRYRACRSIYKRGAMKKAISTDSKIVAIFVAGQKVISI